MSCVEFTIFQDWVSDMGAIIATLEHRYFGLSVPDGFNASVAMGADWAPLTMNNTLLDSVNFIHWIKKSVPGASDSKAIVLGGKTIVFSP
jgi:lysosomal Pro-X carboxypeptidase